MCGGGGALCVRKTKSSILASVFRRMYLTRFILFCVDGCEIGDACVFCLCWCLR